MEEIEDEGSDQVDNVMDQLQARQELGPQLDIGSLAAIDVASIVQ